MRYISVGALNPINRQRIDVRCREIRTPIEAYVTIAKVVRQNDDDVWMVGRLLRPKRAKKRTEGEDDSSRKVFHGAMGTGKHAFSLFLFGVALSSYFSPVRGASGAFRLARARAAG